MVINAGLRFGNMSALQSPNTAFSVSSEDSWMRVFFVVHKLLRTIILGGFSAK